ncbi:MAG: DMT family transporter [Rhizobiaceae bacterium]|nr:DMT family transporter [Rhizobiaceae bacterium]MCV0406262.1 DMT family transporter [Rhizobiaceae bacterium]
MDTQQSNLKAGLWMAGSIAMFLTMSVAGRAATAELDVFQVMLMRSVIGFFLLLPLVHFSGGLSAMKTHRPLMHIGRNVAHYGGQYAWLLALTLIPLAELISIEFTTPFWTALLAVAFLGERMNTKKTTAVVLGIVGVVVIVRPGVSEPQTGHLVMLAGAVAFAVSLVMVKAMTRTESVVRIIFWMLIIQSAIGLAPGLLVWRPPSLEVLPWVVLVAFTGTFSHYCLARALVHAEATVVMPMDFMRLPLSAVLGWAMFSERLDMLTAAGAALILAGNLVNIQRRRPEAVPPETP